MQYTHLGRTGLKVSRLCLGTMNFGPQTDEKDSFAIMDEALSAGINFIDTANVYGSKIRHGATEEIIGRWIKQDKSRRQKIVLATKVYGRTSDWPNDGRLSARHIQNEVEASLKRLNVEAIDLYQMHHVDRSAPWEEIWQAMENLVRQGKILYVGSSNFAGWHIAQAQEIAGNRNFLGLVSEQSLYNLVNRQIELEVIPACEAYGIGLMPWSPLARGILAGVTKAPKEGRRASRMNQRTIKQYRKQISDYETLCKDIGNKPANVAIAWLLNNPVVTAPIIGPRTISQFNGVLKSLDIELDDDVLSKLDRIWPGPGGPAPEAYAW
jgi:aryl-alcohol dehydrogenase-like predicted oxidoreductase